MNKLRAFPEPKPHGGVQYFDPEEVVGISPLYQPVLDCVTEPYRYVSLRGGAQFTVPDGLDLRWLIDTCAVWGAPRHG